MGNALAEIRFRRLYRATHATFESYCQERWGFKRRTAYTYLDAASVAENVHTCAQNPPSLSQARELAVLEPEQQRAIAATTDFANTTVKQLKGRIDGCVSQNGEQDAQSPDVTRKSSTSSESASANHLNGKSWQTSGIPARGRHRRSQAGARSSMVRVDELCQMCRERLFPHETPKNDFPVDIEPTPDQTPVVEREYVAEDDLPEGLRRYQVDGEWLLEGEL